MRKPYYEVIPGLEHLYLQDSYLLDLKTEQPEITMLIEAVLVEAHPLYSSPKDNEQYCYRDIRVVFPNASDITWLKKNMKPVPGSDRPDYGNIEDFYQDEGLYHIEGEWGVIEFRSDQPSVSVLSLQD